MTKVFEFIKKYYLFLLFIVPLLVIGYKNKIPDNDLWFLLNCGKYVFASGIPSIDPFTIHEGLNYIMQQWLSASMFWGMYRYLGEYSLLVFIYLFTTLLMFVFYKLCLLVNGNKKISIILTAICFCLLKGHIVMRPQIFTYLFVIIELLALELYIKNKNPRYLVILPICSLFWINMHCSMWYLQFVFLLPYILNGLKLKVLKKFKIDDYKLKPIIYAMICMFVTGFINPYGYKAMFFIVNAYGNKTINNTIGEMLSPNFSYIGMKCSFVLVVIILLLINFLKKRMDIRHYLFFCGTLLMFFIHTKCFPYYVIICFFLLSYLLNGSKKISFLSNRILVSIFNGLKIGLMIMLFCSLFIVSYYNFKYYEFHPFVSFYKDCEIMADYIEKNYDLNKIVLYTDYNSGGYFEFRGIKSYIDPRAELFVKSFNKKFDYLDEYFSSRNDKKFNKDEFIEKYRFTHIIVPYDSLFDKYLEDNDDYELVYSLPFEGNEDDIHQNLYVLKDFE